MLNPRRLQALRVSLVAIGIACLAFGPLMLLWPQGWRWEPHQSLYEQMMVGIYLTLGVFLLLAARNPLHYLSLIWFTIWSSLVHGVIMLAQAFTGPQHHGHLAGDIPALFIAAALLGTLTPRQTASGTPTGGGASWASRARP